MKLDLFELFEGVVRGIIFFVYSLVRALAVMIRHPFRGPLKLERTAMRRYAQPPSGMLARVERSESRQLGGLVFLFLCYFAQVGLLGNFVDEGFLPLFRMVSGVPRLDSDAAWPSLAGALAATVVIDAALRALLRGGGHQHGLRRRLARGSIEYALGFGWLVFLALLSIFNEIPDKQIEDSIGFWATGLLGWSMLLPALPAATLLRLGLNKRPGRPFGGAAVVFAMIGLWFLMMVAAGTGLLAADSLTNVQTETRISAAPAPTKG